MSSVANVVVADATAAGGASVADGVAGAAAAGGEGGGLPLLRFPVWGAPPEGQDAPVECSGQLDVQAVLQCKALDRVCGQQGPREQGGSGEAQG